MHSSADNAHESIFSTCRHALGSKTWGRVLAAMDEDSDPHQFTDAIPSLATSMDLPGYIVDLARLEWSIHQKKTGIPPCNRTVQAVEINPDLTVVPVSWKNLAAAILTASTKNAPQPEPENAHVMIWRHPKTGELCFREAADVDLLALKLIVEQIDPRSAATDGGVSLGAIQMAIDRAIDQGLLLSPDSRINRTTRPVNRTGKALDPFLSTDIFTLQWHITQACDLHCKHCYDRSDRSSMAVETAMAILDDFYDFCRRMYVKGQVTFTGGNPLLYPYFEDVYQAASEYGFGIAILGNPTPIERIQRLLEIAKPLYFQISLEGLEAHNDTIRGNGHFHRSLEFLDQLRQLDIYTMVMLTLTRDNLSQVLPLAELLQDRADHFTFNRLSTVGEGAGLLMPEKDAFKAFLREYTDAAANNSKMGLKDNLINIIRREKDAPLFGGCTGHGCGAAFNFLSLLPDGEVHACRKFPSLIGNIRQQSLYDIYHCELARKYRAGSHACRDCSLNVVCRGCLAITHSLGLDVFTDKDPFCFVSQQIHDG